MLLDELQLHLRRRGVQVSQKQLIEESIKLAAEQEEWIAEYLHKQEDNTKELTEQFLKHAKKIDFGKDWLTEIDIIQ